jgi:hypothetical protein
MIDCIKFYNYNYIYKNKLKEMRHVECARYYTN